MQDRTDEEAKQKCDPTEVSLPCDPSRILKHKLHHKTSCTSKQGGWPLMFWVSHWPRSDPGEKVGGGRRGCTAASHRLLFAQNLFSEK